MTCGIILFMTGSCKVTEFLLSKGVPVDIDCGRGTPLHQVATNEKDKTVKILLEHHADVYNHYLCDKKTFIFNFLELICIICRHTHIFLVAGVDNLHMACHNPFLG